MTKFTLPVKFRLISNCKCGNYVVTNSIQNITRNIFVKRCDPTLVTSSADLFIYLLLVGPFESAFNFSYHEATDRPSASCVFI